MNRSRMRTWLVAAMALGVWLGASAGAAASTNSQDTEFELAGTWVLNQELSDEVPDRDGRRRGRGGPGFNPERIARMREAMRGMLVAARRLTIEGDRDELVLTFGDGQVVRLITDGREHTSQAGAGAQVKRTARWRGETVETEATLQVRRSLTVRQTYELQNGADGGRQLVITSRVEGGRRGGERENRRVYDAVEP